MFHIFQFTTLQFAAVLVETFNVEDQHENEVYSSIFINQNF